MDAKRFLFMIRRPPSAGTLARETLDQIMTAAAFDQPVTVLALDEGVLQLRRPGPASAAPAALAHLFEALSLYDVEAVLVEQESLAHVDLTTADLVIPVELKSRSEVAAIIRRHDVVVTG